jgi:hypothetical protein
MPGLLGPKDLRMISSEAELEEMKKEDKVKQQRQRQVLELREAFMAQEIHPEVIERINSAVKIAAQHGQSQLQVISFPSSYCADGGRRINIGDPEWPSTLVGFAKKAYEFYDKELRPLGFKLHAEIISFPGGMPGDVGFFLKW